MLRFRDSYRTLPSGSGVKVMAVRVIRIFNRFRKSDKMKNRILLMASLALSAWMQSTEAAAQDNVVDEVVWVVGEEAILKSDVEAARIEAMQNGESLGGDPYCVIPEQLAIQKLFLHQAALDSVEVSDADVLKNVEARISDMIQRVGSKEKLEEYTGKTISQIREKFSELYKNKMIEEQVSHNLVGDIKVTPAQVRQYFKDMPEDSIPFVPTTYEVQLLVRNPVISQAEIDRIKDDLRSYTERVNKGESQFSTLAVLYSEDRGTATRGGETGFMARTQMVPEFATAAFNLTDPKTVSKIVETEYGFHIIQLIEKRGERVNVRHILRIPHVTDQELAACISQVDSIVGGVNKGDYTFDEAVAETSEDKNTRANFGLMYYTPEDNMTERVSKIELKNLPAEVAKAVVNLKVGEISKPFIMVNKSGKEVVAVAKLKGKTNGHRATMSEDYQTLQNLVVNKKSEEKIDQWIRNAQKTTYIRINDNWKNCEFKYPGWVK